MSTYHEIETTMRLVSENSVVTLSTYPVDMSAYLTLVHGRLDATGVPYNGDVIGYHPTTIAQYALACWNLYLAFDDENQRSTFLAQADWLVDHEVLIGDDIGGWPMAFPLPELHTTGSWLSALAQGSAISVLARAYQLTRKEIFLEVVQRAVRTFERDILDGGVAAPIGADGVFFQEVAVYPAAHVLSSFIFALFGLYDYVTLTGNAQIEKWIHRSLKTMHSLLDEFDLGFWTCSDLLNRQLASPAQLTLQAMLLEGLATYSGCDHCSLLASRWKRYQRQGGSRLRYLVTSCCIASHRALWSRLRTKLFPKLQPSRSLRICVPVPAFPSLGGVSTVVEGIDHVTKDIWQLEYLTQSVEGYPNKFVIHQFGTKEMTPWQFPRVWFYCVAGACKLFSLLRNDPAYQVILPQDGVFTSAYAALIAKLAGVRVVCVEHGNLTSSFSSRLFRDENVRFLATWNRPWAIRFLARLLLVPYWPSLHLLARISIRLVDHFVFPGVAGDGIEDACARIGVPLSCITRSTNMINIERHVIPASALRADIREKNGIAADAIVITMVCRLAPEKGIEIALEAISQVLSTLSPDLRTRTRVIIAGDGPIRKQVEEDIRMRGLSQTCLLWGRASEEDVISILGMSNIFLYTSWRGTGYPLAILEAMASGCAVIASTEPQGNKHMLAEGRGLTVPPGNVEQTSVALVRLLNDLDLCHRMGKLARDYIAEQHSPAMLRRTLMRVTYWSALDEFLAAGKKAEAVVVVEEGGS